jgi:hypothetical protein
MMDASLDEGINVGKLAAAVKMSESHFSRETTKPIIEIGMSPTSSAKKQGSVPRVSGENAAGRARGKF